MFCPGNYSRCREMDEISSGRGGVVSAVSYRMELY